MFLTYDADEIYKHRNINRFDGPMRGNGKTSSGGVPKNDVTRSMLIVIDTQAARDHFHILDPPIARMRSILATSFAVFDTRTRYHVRYHFRLCVGVSILSSVPFLRPFLRPNVPVLLFYDSRFGPTAHGLGLGGVGR
jgi:hypothetical protein